MKHALDLTSLVIASHEKRLLYLLILAQEQTPVSFRMEVSRLS